MRIYYSLIYDDRIGEYTYHKVSINIFQPYDGPLFYTDKDSIDVRDTFDTDEYAELSNVWEGTLQVRCYVEDEISEICDNNWDAIDFDGIEAKYKDAFEGDIFITHKTYANGICVNTSVSVDEFLKDVQDNFFSKDADNTYCLGRIKALEEELKRLKSKLK